jgi:iron(III) transport system ATP-binding protein
MPDLAINDLRVRLGDHEILKGLSLKVPAGAVVALLGPSGSGKTTLLRAIAGLEVPHQGSIAIGDRVFFDAARKIDLPAEQRGLGLVFQSYALWPHRNVFDNVAYGLKLRNTPAAEIRTRVGKTLSQIGLGALAERYPHQLSGGQQQRVAIARALVYQPPLLLLDEPLSNLDAKLREEARAWLRTLIGELGISAIHVTHDQTEAMAIADRIVLLDAGTVAQEGVPTALYNEPENLFTAEFMGSNNRLEGVLVDAADGYATFDIYGERITGQARAPKAAGAQATGIIRIERVRCTEEPGPNRLRMQFKTQMYLGERWELVFSTGDLTVRTYAHSPVSPGKHFIEFPPDALWIF